MKYLSVCSGIEAASVAWHPLGWTPLAFSEIEAFPRSVLAHHYSQVPLHGDFTVLRDQPWIVDADILVGGTPCQAFSVAGLRNSLSDDRGNLSLEFVRLADAIDIRRVDAGKPPAIIVWENVPGVLSVKDNAFGCFLAAVAGDTAPYVPPRGKWTNAGVVDGPARQVAWRTLDAQYFGLAQRRRRVFVVASARKGFDPASVLLEFEGVRRDTAPRREAGQVSAHATAPCLTSSGRGVERTGDTRGQDPVVACMAHGQANAEIRTDGGAPTLSCIHEAPIVTHTLKGEGFDASEDGTGRRTPLVPVLAGTLKANNGGGGWSNSGDHAAAGYMVPVAVSLRGRDGGGTAELGGDIQNALRASQGGGDKPHVLAWQPGNVTRGAGAAPSSEVFPTLKSDHGRGASDQQPHVLAATYPLDLRNAGRDPEKHDEMNRQGVGVGEDGDPMHTLSTAFVPGVATAMAVRRLTPVECERLQGFPDGYTNIPWRNKPEAPDGPRYKSLGNSMAVPVMRWIGTRIEYQLRSTT